VSITTTTADAAVPRRFIVKELPAACREADVYALLWNSSSKPPAAEMLGVQVLGDRRFLYLEEVLPLSVWPWSDTALAAAVCHELAALHDRSDLAAEHLQWDYEAQLAASAEETLMVALAARDAAGVRLWPRIGDLRRIVAALPEIRARLLATGSSVIHGDVHPGNVILRANSGSASVALIDWSRTRIGSPLEDVASWLHSLGCWEPQARRRHDTLVKAYLGTQREQRPLCRDFRTAYWLASASNGLAGAIRYHLATLGADEADDVARYHSTRALRAWLRVVRRVSTLLKTRR
jgi:aminoglycoside phosphotransferase (APT) family kinase protein